MEKNAFEKSIGLQHASDAGMCKLYHENSWHELDI